MARRVIDEFSVKPSGFLASWRYARVVIDDITYVVTKENVPGKEAINLPCISDYNKKSRRYSQDQLITEFCNLVTFQKISVFAQDCTPFAYVTVEADSPDCGALGPIPPPASPPRPWGTPVYGLFKYFDFCDRYDRPIRVEIAKKSFAGTPIEIEYGAAYPVIISYADVKNMTDPFHPFEMSINLTATVEGQFDDLYTDDESMFKVTATYTDNGQIKGAGFIKPGYAVQPFRSVPYNISIKVTDGLGALKNVTYPIPYGSKTILRQTWLQVLAYCFAMTNIELPIYTQVNLYEAKMPNNLNDDPLNLSSINPLRFADDKGNIMSCYEVLEYVCKQWTSYIVQSDGNWHFIRVPELASPVVRRRKYQSDGLFLFGEQTDNLVTLGNLSQLAETQIIDDPVVDIQNAYKRVAVLQKFGFVPSVIFNGDFELWDGANFPYWTRYGGINTTRVQNTVPGVNGAPVLVNDYSMQFNEKYDLGKWMQPNDIKVNFGDKVTLSFGVGSDSPATIMDWIYMRIILTDGDSTVWLETPQIALQDNQLTGLEPKWSPSLKTYNVAIGLGPKRVNEYLYSMNLPVMPISGDLSIQMFGFIKRENRIVRIDGVLQDKEYPYSPMRVDNVSIAITNINNNAIPDGVLYISEQQKYYTESPELVTLLFGDNVNLSKTTSVTNPNNVLTTNVLANTISNIYTVDNSFSTLWYEYGLGSDKLPIANWVAKSMLKLFQKPFRKFNTGVLGGFSATNTFQICSLDNQVYAIMYGSFNMKTAQFNGAVLSEMYYKNIPTYNIGTPHNPGQGLPPIFNNPNNPVPVVGVRIFTDEFTQQFT